MRIDYPADGTPKITIDMVAVEEWDLVNIN